MIYLGRLAFFILIVNLFSNALNSQDLTFDVNYASNEVLVGQDSIGVFYGSIVNRTAEDINIAVVRTENVNLDDWTSSICIGSLCYSNWVDSVVVTIENGDSAAFSMYVWTNGEGESSIELELFDIEFPNENMILNLSYYTNETVHISHKDNYQTNDNLIKAYPNPFNSFVVFEFAFEHDSHVVFDIYDINGKHVNTIFNNSVSSGERLFYWDCKNKNGYEISSGLYIGNLQAGNKSKIKKIIFSK